MNPLVSRKFIIAVLALASSGVLCWFGRIDAGVYATVVCATVGSYLAANVTQKSKGTT